MNPLRNGAIILGGTGIGSLAENLEAPSGFMNTFGDTTYSDVIAGNAKREFSDLSREPREIPLRHGEGLDHVWAGILGMTPDSVPLVGPIDGLEGQWICAAFNGHGMFLNNLESLQNGRADLYLSHRNGGYFQMRTRFGQDTGLPECVQFSKERIDRFKEPIKSSL